MDQIAALETQHSDLEDLFHEITLAKDLPTKAGILEELASKLIAHVALEDRLLRRAVATAPRESGLLEAWEGRLRVERIIMALAAIDPGDETFGAKIADLQDVFEDRIEYEETQIFPKLRRFAPRRAPRGLPSGRARVLLSKPGFAMGGTT